MSGIPKGIFEDDAPQEIVIEPGCPEFSSFDPLSPIHLDFSLSASFPVNNPPQSSTSPSMEVKTAVTQPAEQKTKRIKQRPVNPSLNGKWSTEEHKRFLEALAQYGNTWKMIAKKVGTRNRAQIRSHAQKHFLKEKKLAIRKLQKTGEIQGMVFIVTRFYRNCAGLSLSESLDHKSDCESAESKESAPQAHLLPLDTPLENHKVCYEGSDEELKKEIEDLGICEENPRSVKDIIKEAPWELSRRISIEELVDEKRVSDESLYKIEEIKVNKEDASWGLMN